MAKSAAPHLRTALSLLFVLLCTISSVIRADQTPDPFAFKVKVGNSDWRVDGEAISEFDPNIYTHLVSTDLFGGSYWEAQNFGIRPTGWVSLRCGANYDDTVATIYSASPVDYPVSHVMISIASINPDYASYLRSIRLLISPAADMTAATVIPYTGEVHNGALDPFVIDNPQSRMYYRLEFDCAKSVHLNDQGKAECTDGWLALNSIMFSNYDPAGVEEISADTDTNDNISWYTLDGRKVNAPDQPGLYIVRTSTKTIKKLYRE